MPKFVCSRALNVDRLYLFRQEVCPPFYARAWQEGERLSNKIKSWHQGIISSNLIVMAFSSRPYDVFDLRQTRDVEENEALLAEYSVLFNRKRIDFPI